MTSLQSNALTPIFNNLIAIISSCIIFCFYILSESSATATTSLTTIDILIFNLSIYPILIAWFKIMIYPAVNWSLNRIPQIWLNNFRIFHFFTNTLFFRNFDPLMSKWIFCHTLKMFQLAHISTPSQDTLNGRLIPFFTPTRSLITFIFKIMSYLFHSYAL